MKQATMVEKTFELVVGTVTTVVAMMMVLLLAI